MNDFITVARIVRTRGIRGEVVAEILTDFPERFDSLSRAFLPAVGQWERIEHAWFHKNRVILKFDGRDRPEQVQDLVGSEVQVEEADKIELPEDTFYDTDLIGSRVFDGETLVGTVQELFKVGEELTNLVVETPGHREAMIPLVSDFVESVDLADGVIRVTLPPGLLELAMAKTRKRRKG